MRVPLIWCWRATFVGFAVAYLSSDTLQLWISPWPPFLAASAVELQFFVSGLRAGRVEPVERDAGPQARDLEDFGWESPAVPVRPRRKIRRRLLQLALVLALASGLFLLDRSRASWQKLPAHERTATVTLLERVATRIAGHPAVVTCDTGGRHVGSVQEADGLAEVGGTHMWLTPDICLRLATLPRVTPGTEESSGHAIAVLAHEAWHLHGVRSESVANCRAYESGVSVGQAFGLDAGTARRLMREQLAANPGEYADAPAYVVHGCRVP